MTAWYIPQNQMLPKEVQLITLNQNLVQVIMLLKWMRIFMLTDSLGTVVMKVKTAMQNTIGKAKNILFGQKKLTYQVILVQKITCHHNSESTIRIFLVLYKERGEEVDQNYINGFSKKNIFGWDKWSILLLKMMCHLNSGSTQMIF